MLKWSLETLHDSLVIEVDCLCKAAADLRNLLRSILLSFQLGDFLVDLGQKGDKIP